MTNQLQLRKKLGTYISLKLRRHEFFLPFDSINFFHNPRFLSQLWINIHISQRERRRLCLGRILYTPLNTYTYTPLIISQDGGINRDFGYRWMGNYLKIFGLVWSLIRALFFLFFHFFWTGGCAQEWWETDARGVAIQNGVHLLERQTGVLVLVLRALLLIFTSVVLPFCV